VTPIPTITTDRLVLRAPRADDLPAFAAFYGSADARHVGGPQDEAETWRYLAQVIGHWQMRGFGRWMVEEKDTPGAIGLIGLHQPLDWPAPEVGWILWAGKGKGYATEAAKRSRAYAQDTLGLTGLISCIDPENAVSKRVAERLGATPQPDPFVHPKLGTAEIWRHPAPEALQ
jgi:RimJ/RimL family protein N-acetyltransferase